VPLPLLLLLLLLLQGPGSDIFRLVLMVMSRGYDPFIVFSFSKRECEGLALSLAGLDLNSDDEKALVEGVFRWGLVGGRGAGQSRAVAAVSEGDCLQEGRSGYEWDGHCYCCALFCGSQ
jgi:hypothetical protein